MYDGTRRELTIKPFFTDHLLDNSRRGGKPVIPTLSTTEYAALVCSVGYERRSGYLPRLLWSRCGQIWGYGFELHHVHSFDENRMWLMQHGTYFDESDTIYRKHLGLQVRHLAESWLELTPTGSTEMTPLKLAVDISSMSRDRVAQTILALVDDVNVALQIDWLYAPGKFSKDELSDMGPVSINRALPGFEGWTDDPAKPTACILGAGLEGDLALGAVERLEPAQTWALSPTGYDREYDAEFGRRNRRILASLGDTRLVEYDVDQPFTTILQLNTLVSQLRTDYRVVVVPLGPKIFALTALLLGRMLDDLTVWRLSADSNRLPHERIAAGPILGLRTVIRN
jgi:hypothetical protein